MTSIRKLFLIFHLRRVVVQSVTMLCVGLVTGGVLAQTTDLAPRTVVGIGAHDGPIGFVYFAEPFPFTCPYNHAYFDITTPLGKSMFATLNIGKVTGKPVRVWIRQPTSTDAICRVTLAALI